MEFGELVEPDTRAFWDNYDESDAEYVYYFVFAMLNIIMLY